MATGWNVDTDLFANSYSAGVRAGAATPSGFSSFFGGLIGGIDAEIKAESERQQQEIRQNQIDMQPITNQIQTAQADRANMELAGYRADPQKYAALQQQKVENDLAAEQQEAQVNQQKNLVMETLQSDDGIAKGDLLLSGKADLYFTAYPQEKENYIKGTWDKWDQTQRDRYKEIDRQNRERQFFDSKDYTEDLNKTRQEFESNSELTRLRDSLNIGKSVVSPVAFLDGAEIRPVPIPKNPRLKFDEKGNTTGEYERDANGFLIADINEADATKPKGEAYKQGKALFYGGKFIAEVSDQADKAFSDFKKTYKMSSGREAGMGGLPDLDAKVVSLKEQQAEIKAAQDAINNANAEEIKKQQMEFFEGASIKPQFQAAAARVRQQVEGAPTPKAEGPKTVDGKAPEPVEPAPVVKVPSRLAMMSDEQFMAKTVEFASEPQAEASMKFQGQTVPETSWARDMRVKNEMGQAKARAFMQKQNSGAVDIEGAQAAQAKVPPPSPTTQLAQSSADPAFPENVVVNTKERPDLKAARTVASRPDVKNLSPLVKAVMTHESRGKDAAVSPTGVEGAMQLTMGTAARISSDINRDNPIDNVIGGAILLESLNDRYEGNTMLSLTAYNAGEGVVDEAVRLAGTTDWKKVKLYLADAVYSKKFEAEWKRLGVDRQKKAQEAMKYAERVIVNYPLFANTRDDKKVADRLKADGVFAY